MSVLDTMWLGRTDYRISRLGLGCWAVGGHGWGKVNDKDSVRAIKCALDSGITFFDTADVYGLGKSETLLAEVLGTFRRNVVIASKGGVRWNESGKVWTDISPAYLRKAVENSLRRLKLDHIPVYYIHRPDAITPIQESVAALELMREEGKIGAIGVSNFSADQLLEAIRIAKIAAIQIRANILERDKMNRVLNICRENKITLVAWGVLSDGLLTGKFKTVTAFPDEDHRSKMNQFAGDHFLQYSACVKELEQLAASLGHKISHVALRWVLDVAPFTCSLFGTKTDAQVKDNLGADGWILTEEAMEKIDSIIMKYRN